MNTLITLFVSVCLAGQCNWFEIEDPKFNTVQACVEKSIEFTNNMGKSDPRLYGDVACVREEQKEDFYNWLESQGYSPRTKPEKPIDEEQELPQGLDAVRPSGPALKV